MIGKQQTPGCQDSSKACNKKALPFVSKEQHKTKVVQRTRTKHLYFLLCILPAWILHIMLAIACSIVYLLARAGMFSQYFPRTPSSSRSIYPNSTDARSVSVPVPPIQTKKSFEHNLRMNISIKWKHGAMKTKTCYSFDVHRLLPRSAFSSSDWSSIAVVRISLPSP